MNALLGSDQTTEAILLQQRPPWAFVLFLPVFLLAWVVASSLNLPSVLAGAIAGGLGAMSFVTLTSYWILSRSGSDVVLAKSSKLSARAVEVSKTWPNAIDAAVEGAIISKKVTLDGDEFLFARQFESRLNQIVAP